jgi:hypothetical protein
MGSDTGDLEALCSVEFVLAVVRGPEPCHPQRIIMKYAGCSQPGHRNQSQTAVAPPVGKEAS